MYKKKYMKYKYKYLYLVGGNKDSIIDEALTIYNNGPDISNIVNREQVENAYNNFTIFSNYIFHPVSKNLTTDIVNLITITQKYNIDMNFGLSILSFTNYIFNYSLQLAELICPIINANIIPTKLKYIFPLNIFKKYHKYNLDNRIHININTYVQNIYKIIHIMQNSNSTFEIAMEILLNYNFINNIDNANIIAKIMNESACSFKNANDILKYYYNKNIKINIDTAITMAKIMNKSNCKFLIVNEIFSYYNIKNIEMNIKDAIIIAKNMNNTNCTVETAREILLNYINHDIDEYNKYTNIIATCMTSKRIRYNTCILLLSFIIETYEISDINDKKFFIDNIIELYILLNEILNLKLLIRDASSNEKLHNLNIYVAKKYLIQQHDLNNKIMVIVGSVPDLKDRFNIPPDHCCLYVQDSLNTLPYGVNIQSILYNLCSNIITNTFHLYPLIIDNIFYLDLNIFSNMFDLIVFDTGVCYWQPIDKNILHNLFNLTVNNSSIIELDNMGNSHRSTIYFWENPNSMPIYYNHTPYDDILVVITDFFKSIYNNIDIVQDQELYDTYSDLNVKIIISKKRIYVKNHNKFTIIINDTKKLLAFEK
jgi:hypothetical protein